MPRIPFRVSPMLATLVDAPFTRPNWVFEEKYDGVRMIAYKEGPRVTLFSRNAIDRTARYPAIAAAISRLKAATLCLDGEVVVFDRKKTSRFQLLQQSHGQTQFAIFDCLYLDGRDLRKEALSVRRTCLERGVPPSALLLLSARLADDGMQAFKIASRRGLEGIVGKNLLAGYTERRSTEWLKVKVHQEEEFVIGGFTQPTGSRQHIGALLLGVYPAASDRNSRSASQPQKLKYVGKVGTGFSDAALSALSRKFRRLIRANSPFAFPVREARATFVSPQLVAQVSFTEWTSDGKLRHPVYLGLRDDKNPADVVQTES
jgi:bifunctional non-homologous end joining protein LigD